MPQRPFRHPPSAEMAVTGRFNRRKADFGSCSDLPKRAKVKSGDVVWSVPYARLSATHRLDRDPPED